MEQVYRGYWRNEITSGFQIYRTNNTVNAMAENLTNQRRGQTNAITKIKTSQKETKEKKNTRKKVNTTATWKRPDWEHGPETPTSAFAAPVSGFDDVTAIRGFLHPWIRERCPVIGSQPPVVSAQRMFSNVQINSLGRRVVISQTRLTWTIFFSPFFSLFSFFSGSRWRRLSSIFAFYIVRSRDDGVLSYYQLPTI